LKTLTLRKNFYWTFTGNIVYVACQWGILVLLAKLTSPTEVGKFSYALAVTAPIILFANLKLGSAQATDAKHEYSFGHYLALRLSTTLFAIFIIILVALFGKNDKELLLVIIIVGIFKGIESISDVYYGLFQQNERMDIISRSKIYRGVLTLLAISPVLSMTGSLLLTLVAVLSVWSLVLFFYDIRQAGCLLKTKHSIVGGGANKNLVPCWEIRRLWKLIVLTLPLGVSVALGSLYINIPRYFVEHYLGIYELGIFSALAYVLVAGGTVINALGQSASPRLAKLYAGGQHKAFVVLTGKLVSIGIALSVIGLTLVTIAGRQILALVYTAEYSAHVQIFFWLTVAAGIQYAYIFLGSAVNSMRLFRIQMFITLGSVVLILALCAMLTDTYGMMGVVTAMIVGTISEALTYLCVSIYILRNKIA